MNSVCQLDVCNCSNCHVETLIRSDVIAR